MLTEGLSDADPARRRGGENTHHREMRSDFTASDEKDVIFTVITTLIPTKRGCGDIC